MRPLGEPWFSGRRRSGRPGSAAGPDPPRRARRAVAAPRPPPRSAPLRQAPPVPVASDAFMVSSRSVSRSQRACGGQVLPDFACTHLIINWRAQQCLPEEDSPRPYDERAMRLGGPEEGGAFRHGEGRLLHREPRQRHHGERASPVWRMTLPGMWTSGPRIRGNRRGGRLSPRGNLWDDIHINSGSHFG